MSTESDHIPQLLAEAERQIIAGIERARAVLGYDVLPSYAEWMARSTLRLSQDKEGAK